MEDLIFVLIAIMAVIGKIASKAGKQQTKGKPKPQINPGDVFQQVLRELDLADDEDEAAAPAAAPVAQPVHGEGEGRGSLRRQCAQCGAQLTPGQTFCTACGAPAPAGEGRSKSMQHMEGNHTCPHCHALLTAQADFCTQCGKPLTASAKAAAYAPVIPTPAAPKAARTARKAPDAQADPKPTDLSHRHAMHAHETPKAPGASRTQQQYAATRRRTVGGLKPLSEEEFLKTVMWTEILGRPGGRRAR